MEVQVSDNFFLHMIVINLAFFQLCISNCKNISNIQNDLAIFVQKS